MLKQGSGRRCIGLVIDDIVLVGGHKAWTGACEEARERGVDLVCLRSALYGDLAQFPPAWDLIPQLDGVVVYQPWPSLASFEAFRDRYPNARMVNAVRLYEGCPGLTPDSFGGMHEMVLHFIDVHGYRKIAFVAGPEGNWSADERLRGYREALKERGIEPDERLVTPHYGWGDGFRGVNELLATRGLKPGVDFEAILAPNDSMALSILDELGRKGILVPETVAVAGFDNDIKASFSSPTLTTTTYDVGRHATKVLIDWLEGASVPDKTLVPAHPVIRRSCGCRDARVLAAGILPAPSSSSSSLAVSASKGTGPGVRAAGMGAALVSSLVDSGFGRDEGQELVSAYLDAFNTALEGDFEAGKAQYLDALYRLVPRVPAASEGPVLWQDLLSTHRQAQGPILDGLRLSRAESLWQQARILVAEASEVWISRARAKRSELDQALRETETALMTTFNVEGLAPLLKERLPRLGIQRAWIWLQEDEQTMRLLLDMEGDSRRLNETCATTALLDSMRSGTRRANLLVEPLSFQGRSLGIVVFELGPLEGDIYVGLRSTLSSAIQGSLLIEDIRNHASQVDRIVANTVTTSEEIQRMIAEAASQSHQVLQGAQASIEAGKAGQQAVQETIRGIEQIRDRVGVIARSIEDLSARVYTVTGLIEAIENIIGLTDVLAINASIQAARAGEKGLGFAVVAKEMRGLAEQSRNATLNVGELLKEIRSAAENAVKVTEAGIAEAERGQELAGKAGTTISELSATIEQAASAARDINAGTERQEEAIHRLVDAVKAMKDASASSTSGTPE